MSAADYGIAFDFDVDAMQKKYADERDKRIRPDGNNQYQSPEAEFGYFAEDPFVTPGYERAPLTDDVEMVVIGAGFGGMLAAVRLIQAGVENIRIIDKAGDFGGTWYWNRFPGAMSDIESYIYMPLLEELGYIPSEKYASGEEIFRHCQAIGDKFGLYERAWFQTEVNRVSWQENSKRWLIETDRNDRMTAQFVVMCNGILHRAKLPGIPGIESFSGHSFHTCRWDYSYTGGSPSKVMENLSDKRVAVVGTGATAIQCVPPLAKSAKQLYVFQRTPSSVAERNNQLTDPEWARNLPAGWQQARQENFNQQMLLAMPEQDLVADGWTDGAQRVKDALAVYAERGGEVGAEQLFEAMDLVDMQKMQEVRQRADDIVNDPAVAASLKPYYYQYCKRPCFHDEYLQAFNRSNVTLVDTAGIGVEKITQNSIWSGGKAYAVDCIIFATGFDFMSDFATRTGYPVLGVNGVSIVDKWDQGFATLYGMQSRGFPNCFIMGNMQSTFTVNFPHTLDEQARHIAYVLGRCHEKNIVKVDVSASAEQDWVTRIIAEPRERQEKLKQCTPSYYNREGEGPREDPQYGAISSTTEFFNILRAWREEGSMSGLECETSSKA